MAREFRLEMKVELPDAWADEAEALMAIKPLLEAFEDGIIKVQPKAQFTYGPVTPKPRGEKLPSDPRFNPDLVLGERHGTAREAA